MALDNFKIGPNDVPTYQMSAVPFVTSSAGDTVPAVSSEPTKIQLPNVSRFFIIQNTSAHPLRFGFTRNGIKALDSLPSNYMVLSGNQSTGRLEIRCKDIFFLSDTAVKSGFTLLAGVTPITPSMFPILTGSDGYKGVG